MRSNAAALGLMALAALLLTASAIPTEAEKQQMKANPACVSDIVGSESPTSPPDGHVNVHDLMKLMSAFDKEVQDKSATHYLVRFLRLRRVSAVSGEYYWQTLFSLCGSRCETCMTTW